jgi:hypothetical protein
MHPVMESLLEEAARDPYPREHTSPYWRSEGEALSIRRNGEEIQLRGFGVGTAGPQGIAWGVLHALERASYRGTTARLRSYERTWTALRTLAQELSLPIAYDTWKSAVILAILADHWENQRLSPHTFAMIGDGCGILGALIRRVRPGGRMFCIDLPKALVFQSHLHGRADPKAALSRALEPGRGRADVVFALPQEIDSIAETIDCAINIASMQEMNDRSIRSYFQFLRKRSGPASHFYCVNRREKELPGGEISRLEDYPWTSNDRIFFSEPCPYYTHYFSRRLRPLGPRWLGVRIPFVNTFDGPMWHRLVQWGPIP